VIPLRCPRFRPISVPLAPLLLGVLALLDLRGELRLLVDQFTITALLAMVGNHPLAIFVLLLQPSLWRRYRSG
jgi:hypothetical protein